MSAERAEAAKKHLCWMVRGRDGVWTCQTEGCGARTMGFNRPLEPTTPPIRGHLRLVE